MLSSFLLVSQQVFILFALMAIGFVFNRRKLIDERAVKGIVEVLVLVVIGLGSFLLSLLGHWLGRRFGAGIRRRLKPELLGGIILIAIGVKVLITHLCGA